MGHLPHISGEARCRGDDAFTIFVYRCVHAATAPSVLYRVQGEVCSVSMSDVHAPAASARDPRSTRRHALVAAAVVAAGVGGALIGVATRQPAPASVAVTPAAGHSMHAPAMQHAMHAPTETASARPLTGGEARRAALIERILAARAERDGFESRRGLLLQQRAVLGAQLATLAPGDRQRDGLVRQSLALKADIDAAAASADQAAGRVTRLEAGMAATVAR